jgi:hypothetical protein
VPDTRRGCHYDSRPGNSSPPTQVDVLAEQVDVGVKPPQCIEQIRPHEHAAARHGEYFSDFVVLGLVELARFDSVHCDAEAVHAQTDLEQAVGRIPVDHLGTHDARVGAISLSHQVPQSVRFRSYVVVTEDQMGSSLHRRESLVGCCGVAIALRLAQYEGARQHGRDPRCQLLLAGGVDHEHIEVRIVLPAKSFQALFKPWSWITCDHHSHYRRGDFLCVRLVGHLP